LIDCNYIDDIWNGNLCYNEEHNKRIIDMDDKNHEKLIQLIISIGKEKNYNNIR